MHESSKLEPFQWGVKILGVQIWGGGVKSFGLLQKFRFPTIIFPAFWAWGTNSPNRPEKKSEMSDDIFCSSFAFHWEFDNKPKYVKNEVEK